MLNRPNHRLDTDANRGIIELDLEAIRTVVDDHLTRAVRTEQELDRVPVGVPTTDRAVRDSVNDEKKLSGKRQVLRGFAEGE